MIQCKYLRQNLIIPKSESTCKRRMHSDRVDEYGLIRFLNAFSKLSNNYNRYWIICRKMKVWDLDCLTLPNVQHVRLWLIVCYWGCLIVDVSLEMSMSRDLLLVIIISSKPELITRYRVWDYKLWVPDIDPQNVTKFRSLEWSTPVAFDGSLKRSMRYR